MAHRIHRHGLASLVVLGSLLGACTIGEGQPAQLGTRERQQAEQALSRWAAAVKAGGGEQGFVPVGELTGQIGDWEEPVGENNKPALMAGMVVATGKLPANQPGDGEIRWEDGTTRTMPTISAAQAVEQIRLMARAGCPECKPLEVTSAVLSNATFQTSRGAAIAPAWEFEVKGTSVIVTRLAVAPEECVVVVPPPWDPNDAPIGISIESARGSSGGRQLTVAFTGAPERGDKACGADYTAEAVESTTALVVIVIPHSNPFPGACTAVGATRTATVELANPLGDRAVLEVKEGLPVPVVVTP